MSSEKPLSSQFWISYCAIHPTFYEVRGYQRWELQVFWKETTRSVSAKLREKLACDELRQPSQGEKSETFSSGIFLSFVAKKRPVDIGKTRTSAISENDSSRLGGSRTVVWRQSRWPCQQDCFHGKIRRKNHPSFFRNPNIQKSPLSPVANLYTLIYVFLCFLIDLFKRYHYQNLCLHVYKETKNTHKTVVSQKLTCSFWITSDFGPGARPLAVEATNLVTPRPSQSHRDPPFPLVEHPLAKALPRLVPLETLDPLDPTDDPWSFPLEVLPLWAFWAKPQKQCFFFAENSRWPKTSQREVHFILFSPVLSILLFYLFF